MTKQKSAKVDSPLLITSGIELLGQCFHIFSKKWKKLVWLLFVIPLIVAGLSLIIGTSSVILISLIFATKVALTWKIVWGVVLGILCLASILFAIFISIISHVGAIYVIDSEMSVKEVLKKSLPLFWKYLGWAILSGIIVGIGFVLFVVPGVILAVMLCFSMYVLVLEGVSPIGALKRSGELVKGFWWTVFARLVVVGIFAMALSIAYGMINNLGTSLSNNYNTQIIVNGANKDLAVVGIIIVVIAFVISMALGFVTNSITMIYNYLLYKQLNELKNSDALARDNMSSGKKVGLGFLIAFGIIVFILMIVGFILFASLATMKGASGGQSSSGNFLSTTTANIVNTGFQLNDLQPKPAGPAINN